MKWEQKHLDFLIDNVKGISCKELTIRFNEFFNESVTISAVKNLKTRLKLKSGVPCGRFYKGQPAWNKGLSYIPKGCEKGWFKKGEKPHNTKPLGSERITVDGYIQVKIAEPNKWELKQRLVWEKHNGELPKGKIIIFLDGNSKNVNIENLAIISRAEHAKLNQKKLRFQNADLTKAGITLTRLNSKIKENNQ